jgi:hypothetical protein
MSVEQHPSPRSALMRMLVGNQVQQAIHVATTLRIPDLLAEGGRTMPALADAAGADPTSLRRLLRALASFGVFAEEPDGTFVLTPIASLLRHDVPGSLRPFALWSGGDRYAAFGALEFSVRTGCPAFEQVTGSEFWEYLEQNAEAAAIFDAMMSSNTAPLGPIVAACDFEGADVIVDVGGGHGELLAAVLLAHPEMRGILADKPHAIAGARRVLTDAGVDDRCGTICADIMTAVPAGARAYLMKSVVHGLDDDAAARLLGNCRRAIHESGKLLLIEFVLPPGNEPFPGKLMDLLMLIGCRGRERTAEEFRELLRRANFQIGAIAHTRYGYSIIEARPVS